jgi:D-glycero-alpha-D-manno-heptose-7-phosphate kinase
MYVTRTPLRITLGGGGTDLPGFYRDSEYGFLIAASITKYVYIAVHENFDRDILLKYSELERVSDLEQIRHPILRECIRATGIRNGFALSSMADIPTGTGLGSSGSFTVGVLRALRAFMHLPSTPEYLAKMASDIEINKLKQPVGKQDQYIAAFGGLTSFTFRHDESVEVEHLAISDSTRFELTRNLLMFYTGIRRGASDVLDDEANRNSKTDLRENLLAVRDLGYLTRDALVNGDLSRFGELLTEQWNLKHSRQPSLVNENVNEWIKEGIGAGAVGGKLIGAGEGGFLLFYSNQHAELRKAMSANGLPEIPFGFDYEGSLLISV